MLRNIDQRTYELILKMAYKFNNFSSEGIEYDMYISAGIDGYINSADNYKSDKTNASFYTFIAKCIKFSMCKVKDKMSLRSIEFDYDTDCSLVGDNIPFFDSNVARLIEETEKYLITNFGKRNADIYMRYIGLHGDKEKSEDIAEDYHVTKQRIVQICTSIRTKIKENAFICSVLTDYVEC